MRNIKYARPFLNLYNREGMIRYLEKQARKGWMFAGFGGFGWKFRRIVPKKVHFSIVYFFDASVYDSVPTQELIEFRDYCAHAGWVFVGSSVNMQIFYNESENPTPIETDPVLEVEKIHKVEKKKNVTELIRTFCFFTFVGICGYMASRRSIIDLLTNQLTVILCFHCAMEFLIAFFRAAEHYFWYTNAKRQAAQSGVFPESRSITVISQILGYVCAVIVLAFYANMFGWVGIVFGVLLFMAIFLISILISRWMSDQLYDRQKTKLVTYGIAYAVIPVIIIFVRVIVPCFQIDQFAPPGSRWARYEQEPPLSVVDILGPDEAELRYSGWVEETPFLARFEVYTYADYPSAAENMDYTILEIKMPAIYNQCKSEMVEQSGVRENETSETITERYFSIDAAPWGAKEAFQYGIDETDCRNMWLLCYEDLIVEITMSFDPDEEQRLLIGQIFAN